MLPSTAKQLQTPFSSRFIVSTSVLAVKGSLRRFAPWTAPGRSERRAAYEGKVGVRISASDFVSHLIAFDSIAPQTGAVGREGEIAHDKSVGYRRRPNSAAGEPGV